MALGKKTGGRTKGTPNKVSQEFRETVQRLLDDNSQNVARWLALVAEGIPEVMDADGKVATKGVPAAPDKALDLLAKLAEFAAPKLSRSEVDANLKGEFSIVDTIRAFHERRTSDSDVQK